MRTIISFLCFLSLVTFMAGIANGMASYSWSCSGQYLNFRQPIHYIAFPHTIGFYLGRVLTYPYGSDRSYLQCENILNHTLEGPKQ